MERMKRDQSDSLTCFEQNIDLEVCDVQFEYLDHWSKKLKSGEITEEELNFALNTYNNVALSMKLLIQVNKPGRVSMAEVENFIRNKENTVFKRTEPVAPGALPTVNDIPVNDTPPATPGIEEAQVTPSVTQVGVSQS